MIKSIIDLEEYKAIELAQDLEQFEPNIHEKVKDIIDTIHVPYVEALEYVVTIDAVLWAYVYLNWTPRDYQIDMLREATSARRLVLRLGRRLGKTEISCIAILWFAYTQRNRVSETQYDILIIGPYETQVDLIFARLSQLIEASSLLKDCLVKDIQHHMELSNGTTIKGKTAGASSGGTAKAGASTRGLRADVLFADELDYIGSAQITNIQNILNDNPKTARFIVASTPCGKREEFYRWCTDASKTYRPLKDDIDNFRFSNYIIENNDKGNGWVQIYSPSVVNKNLLEINVDTNRTYLEDLKFELTELRFDQEVMANFGEEELGIYQKRFIDSAIEEGRRIGHSYLDHYTHEDVLRYKQTRRMNKIMLGVTLDKFTEQIA